MIKIGGVSIDVSHPKAFATYLESNCMNMRYEFIAKESFRDDTQADWFVKRFGLKCKVNKIEDMVDKVDIGFIQSCNWEKHLDQAMPFIEKGKPVFIDKPIVGSMKDIERLRALVSNGAKIYGSSSVRYCKEIRDFLNIDVKERGEIVSIYASCGMDEFNYAIHVVEGISALAQSKAVSGRYLGKSVGSDGVNAETFSVNFENGIMGIYQIIKGNWYPFTFTVMTTKSTYTFGIDADELYGALLKEIYYELKNKKSRLTDCETLINCTQAMLCGKKSKESCGGEVEIDMLDSSDKFDGYEFENGYSKTAAALYKD